MATNDDGALNRVAEAINDGTPVDWDKELGANRHLTPKLQRLRLVESVAKAHKTPEAETVLPGAENDDSLQPTIPAHRAPAILGDPERLSTWGPLRLMGTLGRGGFGEVYRAFDPTLQREVALKLRRAGRDQGNAAEERFIMEARRLASVRHPNVVVVHGADRHEGRAGLWTDLVHGKTLDQVLADQGPFGDHEAATVGITLCGALAAVHAAGLVHRDIKTANIMREQGGRIVLMDFGSVVERVPGDQRAPGDETVSGTPLYMAPELILENRPASPVSDIYALGVVLFHLVTGRFPIEANTWKELIEKHRDGRRLRLRDLRPEISPAFVQVVESALNPDPDRRYSTVGEMEQALATCSGSAMAAATPVAGPMKSDSTWSRRRLAFGLAGALLVVAAIAGALALLLNGRAGPLAVEASIYRMGEGGEVRLLPGGRVRPGDRLFLEIQGEEPMYVYVLNEDETGNSFVLFPAGLDLANPLPPGARHRLPGKSAAGQMTWQVTSPGRKENFLVIASRTPLDAIERDLAKLPRAEEGREVAAPQVSPESLEHLRGVGGMVVGESGIGGGAGTLDDLSRRLVAGAAGDRGLWTWHIQLENPE